MSRAGALPLSESLLDRFSAGRSSATDDGAIKFDDIINNVRLALEWCLIDQGEIETGVALAAKSAQLFLRNLCCPNADGGSAKP